MGEPDCEICEIPLALRHGSGFSLWLRDWFWASVCANLEILKIRPPTFSQESCSFGSNSYKICDLRPFEGRYLMCKSYCSCYDYSLRSSYEYF